MKFVNRQNAGEFIKFAVTGGLGTVTNLILFFLFADLLRFPEIPVSAGCFVVAGFQNYLINHFWSFRNITGGKKASFSGWLKFFAGSLLGLAVNILVMKAVIVYFNPPFKFIGQGCGIASGMVINFFISKYFVFKKKGENNDGQKDSD
jgi:putative flippase GtrA